MCRYRCTARLPTPSIRWFGKSDSTRLSQGPRHHTQLFRSCEGGQGLGDLGHQKEYDGIQSGPLPQFAEAEVDTFERDDQYLSMQ